MVDFKKEKKRLSVIKRRLGLKTEIYLFLSNLSILISSGITIPEAIKTIRLEISSKRLKKILLEVEDQVNQGASLSSALNNSGILSARIFTLLRIGEESGRLVTNLELINIQNDKEIVFRSKVRSSLLYALIVLVIAIIVMLATSLIILPRLASFYGELEVELPTITKAMIATGTFLASYGYILLPLTLMLLIFILYFLFSFPKTRYIGHSLLFHIPIVRKLLVYSEVSSLGFLLGSELRAGIPMLQALSDLPSTTTFKNYQHLYQHLEVEVSQGKGLKAGLASYPEINKLIPSQALVVLSAGEKSGKLSDSLLKIGNIYERKVDVIAKNLPTIIEPIIIVFIGIFIAVISLASILPIYSLNSAF